MKLFLVRHGAVEEPYSGKYNGHNTIGLSHKGKADMQKLANRLQQEHFDGLFSSDLPRAKESIEPFCFKDIIYTTALREKSWGRHEGMSFEEIVREGVVYENFLQWIDALDGEPYRSYLQRVNNFFEKLLQSNHKQVFVMTHAGVIRTFLAETLKISLQESFSIELPYGAVVVFDTNSKTFSTFK